MLCRYIFLSLLLVMSGGVYFGNNYGSYLVKVLSYSIQSYKPFVIVFTQHNRYENGTSNLEFYGNITKNMGVLGLKIRAYTWDESLHKFSQGINIALRNMCEKKIGKYVISSMPNLGRDCRIKPGEYNFTISNFDSLLQTITNGKFFYGKYMTVTDVFTDKIGRFLKINVTIGIEPKQ